MATYGHRHLGFFYRPVVDVDDHGLRYKGNEYRWNGIRRIEVHDSPFDPNVGFIGLMGGYPWATVYFSDGERLRLNGRALEKQGEKPEIGFFSQRSSAFQELLVTLKAHVVTITPSAREIALFYVKLVAGVVVGLLVVFGILRYLDARL